MKAIFINTNEKSVHYIELSKNNFVRRHEIYDRLRCKLFAIGATLPTGDVLFVDDEGLLKPSEDIKLFKLNDYQSLAGNGIILGPEIEYDDCTYTIDDVQTPIEEIRVRFY